MEVVVITPWLPLQCALEKVSVPSRISLLADKYLLAQELEVLLLGKATLGIAGRIPPDKLSPKQALSLARQPPPVLQYLPSSAAPGIGMSTCQLPVSRK